MLIMKTKTTYVISIILFIVFYNLQGVFAQQHKLTTSQSDQVATPDVCGMTNSIDVLAGLKNINISTTFGNSFVATWQDASGPHERTTQFAGTHGNIRGISQKPGIGNEDKFYVLLNDGAVYLFKMNTALDAVIYKYRKDSIISGSPNFQKIIGDALYIINSGQCNISRDSGLHWITDTLGTIGQKLNDFTQDSAQNVYAVELYGNYLYYQPADTSVWHTVGTYPGGTSPNKIFIDRKDRFFVGTNNNGVYYSYDQGKTWAQSTSGLTSVYCGKMCDDVFGNIYMINNGGNKIYRSIDGGANWTEPSGDTAITNKEAGSALPPSIINDIVGDTALRVATAYNEFLSIDSGKTWMQDTKGYLEASINGFWEFSNGRMVQTSSNGVFWLNKGDSVWHKPLPTTGYGNAGIIYTDTIGNTYVNQITAFADAPDMKSSDNGNTWQADTLGNYHITIAPKWWVDQYGNEHNANSDYSVGVYVYSKTPSNPYVLDTLGIGIISGTYEYVSSWGSDRAGYLYMSGYFKNTPNILRRPILGGKWVSDTAGALGQHFLAMACDYTHHMVGSPIWQNTGLYYRNAGIWTTIPYPSAISAFDNVSAIACDTTGGILAAFNGYDFVNNVDVGNGVYCTHDYGISWNYVGLDSIIVNQLVNCGGDTTYALTQGAGVYKLVCSGVINTTVQKDKTTANLQNSVALYPNPTNGNFTLEYKLKVESGELRIYDITGKQVYTSRIISQEGKQTINASQLNNGIYFWQVFAGDKLIEKGKIAVVK